MILLFVLMMMVLLGTMIVGVQYFAAIAHRERVEHANKIEGFASEINAWHSFYRSKNGFAPIGAADTQNRYVIAFDPGSDKGLPTSLAADPYSPGNYTSGVPLNIKTTMTVDTGNTLLRRFNDQAMRYLVQDAATKTSCGSVVFKDGQKMKFDQLSCLVGSTVCPAPAGCSYRCDMTGDGSLRGTQTANNGCGNCEPPGYCLGFCPTQGEVKNTACNDPGCPPPK